MNTSHPSREDPLIGWLSELVGGRRGHRAGPTAPVLGWLPGAAAVSVLLVTASMIVAVLTRQPCRTTLWASPGQFTHACYSDIPTLYSSQGLASRWPYLDAPPAHGYLTEPVGTGFLIKLLGVLTPGGGGELRHVFDAGALLVALAALALVLVVARLAGARPWDAALVAGSPVLVFAGLVTLDLTAIAAALGAVLALRRDRPLLAGLLIGIAVCVRPFALVVPLALILVHWRRRERGELPRLLLVSVLTWSVVNLPIALAATAGWAAYWVQAFSAPIGVGSLWGLPGVVADAVAREKLSVPPIPLAYGFVGVALVVLFLVVLVVVPSRWRRRLLPLGVGATAVLGLVLAGLPLVVILGGPRLLEQLGERTFSGWWIQLLGGVVTVALVAWLMHRAPRPPRLPTVLLLLTIGFQVSSPSLPVQASLWVLAFAALAVPSWRDLLIWGWAESFAIMIVWFHLYGLDVPDRGAPPWVYTVALFARFTGLGLLAFQACTQALWWSDDVVRRRADDPSLSQRLTAVPRGPRVDPVLVEGARASG